MDRSSLETPRVDDTGFKHRTVYVCMPTRGMVSVPTHTFLMNKEEWCQRANIGNFQEFMPVGLAVREARELALKLVDEHRRNIPEHETWILWMDDDMDPPHHNTVAALRHAILYSEIHSLRHKDGAEGLCGECNIDLATPVPAIGICSAYCSRKEPMDSGLIFAPGTKLQLIPKIDFEVGEIVEVEWCGLGFALMRGSWLDKFPHPRFDTANSGGGAEDHDFTLKLRSLGCIPYVHTGVKMGHYAALNQSVFFPYITPNLKPAGAQNGHAVEPFIPAWMTCGMPQLNQNMTQQFANAKRMVAFDNGGDPPATSGIGQSDGASVRIIRSDTNLLWARGFNEAMARIAKTYPDAKAIWLCNDDITGASVEMGRELYKRLTDYPDVAAVSPAILGSKCPHSTPHSGGLVRKVRFVDFVAPMISLAAWRKIGPLDPDTMGDGWGNDMEWGYRADLAGYQILVDDAQIVNHEHFSQTCEKLGNGELHWKYNMQGFEDKHGVKLEDWLHAKILTSV